MISRMLFILSSLFVVLAIIEVSNIHLGYETTLHGKVVKIILVDTPTMALGFYEVKDYQHTQFLVDVSIKDAGHNFTIRCEVKSLDGIKKEADISALVLIGKFYSDRRCFGLENRTEDSLVTAPFNY